MRGQRPSWRHSEEATKLIIVNEDKGVHLFGLDWSDAFRFSARGMLQLDRHSVEYQGKTDVLSCYTQATAQGRETFPEHPTKASQLATNFPNVFSSKLGCCTKFKVSLQLKPGAKSAFCKPRRILFAVKHAVKTSWRG